MNYFPVTFVLAMVCETLIAAVLSGANHLTDGQEIEENLIISRRKSISEHDHRTDDVYAGILTDEDEIDDLKHLEPFEIKQRMKTILDSMDKNKNGFIEKNELSSKLLETYKKLSTHEADSEFQSSDVDENNYVTWPEYIGETYASSENLEEEEAIEEKAIFFAADLDKDNQLNKIEFRYFYTPEDYPFMKSVLMDGVMSRFDINKDSKITFDEFIGDRKLDSQFLQEEKTKFTDELDINKNGVLENDEIHIWASPNNNLIAESEADHLIAKSDKNFDEMLSYDEILDNYLAFISPDSDVHYIFKDEL